MGRIARRSVVLAVATVALVPAAAAHAAEVPVGSASRSSAEQYDHVPGLWAGTTGWQSKTERGDLSLETGPGRCEASGWLGPTLVATRPPRRGVRLRDRRIRLRGTREHSLVLRARRVDRGGVDPTSKVMLTGQIPADMAPGEPRRILILSATLTSEEEGCLPAVARAATRLVPSLYLRRDAGAPPRIGPVHSPTRRIDGGAPARIGGPMPGAAIGGRMEAAGDVDGDGRGEVLMRESELSDHGARYRALVRFGGLGGIVDSARFGAAGFALSGARDAGGEGPNFAPAGNFLRGPTTALAATIEIDTDTRGNELSRRAVVAVVVPGRRYRGFVDPRRPPPGAIRLTAPRGCDSQALTENVGDVNGDGYDDLYVGRVSRCASATASIVFGGRTGDVALDSLGSAGIRLYPEELENRLPVAAGDVNGDGLGDLALLEAGLYDHSLDELVLVLGRPGAGRRSVRSGPSLVRIRRKSCDDLYEVTPAGDLDGDGADELVLSLGECSGRSLDSDVAHVLRGSRALPVRLRLGPATGTTIRSRFGPLGAPAVAAGSDVSGGPAPDIALGFPGGGPDGEGEAWILKDVTASETLTLGALGTRAVRLLGSREGFEFGADVAFVSDRRGDRRADLLIGAPEEEFAGRPHAGTVYTYAAGAAPGPTCRVARTGAGRVWGTDLGDVLTGSAGADRLVGFEGGDCIRGQAGRDRLVGDPGPDILDGGDGADRLNGGPGRDVLAGGAGDDLVLGGPRGDGLGGGPGDDRIDGREGAGDYALGGPGDDLIRASDRGEDSIDCGAGRDVVVADRGDHLRGCERVRRYSPPVYDD